MEAKIERLYKIIDLRSKAFENLESNEEEIRSSIEKLLSGISLEAWWRNVITRSHEDFEKLCQYASGKSSMTGSIDENITYCQGTYNQIKNLCSKIGIILAKDEKRILEVIPSNTSIAKFLKGKSKGRYNQMDLEHHIYLLLWANLRLFPFYKDITNVNAKKSVQDNLDASFKFVTSHTSTSQAEIYDTLLSVNNNLHSPQFFLCLHKPSEPIVTAVYKLLLANKLIKEDPSSKKEIFKIVKNAAAYLGLAEVEMIDDYNKCQDIIDLAIKTELNGVSVNDDSIEKLFSDLMSITDDSFKPKASYYFVEELPYINGLRKKLYDICFKGVMSGLHTLFVYMNANLLGIDNRKIVSLLRSKSFCGDIQKEYDKFRKDCQAKTLDFEFAPTIRKILLSDDFEWGTRKSSSCFNIPWNRLKIQKLYDSLCKSYIDRETDVRDFCYALTGCKPANTREFKKVNWVHEHKQSLALFIGELINRDPNGIKGSRIPKVFLYKGKDITFHSTTQCNQARKSGKYDDLLNAVLEAEELKVDIDKIV